MWFFLLFFYLTSEICHPRSVYALETSNSINLSASINDTRVTIFGYTSPLSKVELTGINIYAATYSDNTGYFIFDKTILPKNPSELCLQSTDNESRTSSPVCISPPPATNYDTDIGPILLSPTLSLDKNTINPNSTVISSGQAIPNSPVSIYFYQVNDKAQSFVKEAQAFSLPVLTTTSDKNGYFSFNLPTSYSSNYRLYATTEFDQNLSPKSNTLLYKLPSIWWLFWQQNQYLVFILPIFIVSLILFVLLLFFYFQPYHLHIKKYLPAVRNWYPALIPTHKIPD